MKIDSCVGEFSRGGTNGDATSVSNAETSISSGGSSPTSSSHDGGATAGQYAPTRTIPQATSAAELREICFPLDLDLVQALRNHDTTTTTSAVMLPLLLLQQQQSDEEQQALTIEALQAISRNARGHLMELTVSRTGRELQRYGYAGGGTGGIDHDSTNGTINNNGVPNCRLTTGCIPILPGGRILLISSTKSQEVFVLPKGGWEQDESLPLSALRETLEEAGVSGLLGPPLPSLTYETKKAVKRRITLESSQAAAAAAAATEERDPRITAVSAKQSEQHRPVATTTTTTTTTHHTHNRLIIFPMYVQSIYDHWPEENRKRRAVTIEEAAVLLRHRPEFSHMLQALRERNLHRLFADP